MGTGTGKNKRVKNTSLTNSSIYPGFTIIPNSGYGDDFYLPDEIINNEVIFDDKHRIDPGNFLNWAKQFKIDDEYPEFLPNHFYIDSHPKNDEELSYVLTETFRDFLTMGDVSYKKPINIDNVHILANFKEKLETIKISVLYKYDFPNADFEYLISEAGIMHIAKRNEIPLNIGNTLINLSKFKILFTDPSKFTGAYTNIPQTAIDLNDANKKLRNTNVNHMNKLYY